MFKPLRDNILIKPTEAWQSDLISVVHSSKESQGTVIAVGPGKKDKKGKRIPLDAKPGDLVRFGTEEGYLTYPELKIEGETFLLISEKDVCFVAEQ